MSTNQPNENRNWKSQQKYFRQNQWRYKIEMQLEPMEEHQRCNKLVLSTRKEKQTFLSYIIDFTQSFLINMSIEWAWKHASIDDQEYETIMHSRRIPLYDNKGNMWTKKDIKKQFHVSMGAFDGAEVCELIGLCNHDTINEYINY